MRVENGTGFLEFEIPTRGLIGYRTDFMADTKGQGIINSLFLGYRETVGDITANEHGSMISMENGVTMHFALANLQERGALFIGPAVQVYVGMIIGQYSRVEDIEVNPCKEKKLSNMRSKGDGAADSLDTPRDMTLENALEFIGDDELLEVTPKSLRIRKAILDSTTRKRLESKKVGT